jgi:hypothetical protein
MLGPVGRLAVTARPEAFINRPAAGDFRPRARDSISKFRWDVPVKI